MIAFVTYKLGTKESSVGTHRDSNNQLRARVMTFPLPLGKMANRAKCRFSLAGVIYRPGAFILARNMNIWMLPGGPATINVNGCCSFNVIL
jgi:hypothetical protein